MLNQKKLNQRINRLVDFMQKKTKKEKQVFFKKEEKNELTEQQLEGKQKELNLLMIKFQKMNKHDYTKVLKWVVKVQEYTAIPRLNISVNKIIIGLKEAGYRVNENCGEEYLAGDKENEARYIIGQVLSNMQHHKRSIDPIIKKFSEDWLEKYVEKNNVIYLFSKNG